MALRLTLRGNKSWKGETGRLRRVCGLHYIVPKRSLSLSSFFALLLLVSACTSEQRQTDMPPNQSTSGTATTPSAARPQRESLSAQHDIQMSVEGLRDRLEEVKAMEREARRVVTLRQNWAFGAAECMRIIGRLKPRASAIRDEYQRMLSPAGVNIASAAMGLIGCLNCIQDDDDDCSNARDFIKKAERELKREMRQK